MPANYVDDQYTILEARKNRIDTFYTDLDARLIAIGLGSVYHMEIYFDGSFVRVIATDAKLNAEPLSEKLKYYNQALGLMKLGINKVLYP